MFRVFALWILVSSLAAVDGHAFQATGGAGPTRVYEAYYQVSPGAMAEWNDAYFSYSVPALEKLVEKGTILGFAQWQHHTGGSDYNVRFAVRTNGWEALNRFWEEYFTELEASAPAETRERISRMIQAHRDEIWSYAGINVPEDYEPRFGYAATYRVNFGDEEEWSRIWNEVSAPIIDQAMADGLVQGWVRMAHDTGGPHNYKVLYLFDEWDSIDDFFARVSETAMAQSPEDFATFGKLIQAHDDVIWVQSVRGGM